MDKRAQKRLEKLVAEHEEDKARLLQAMKYAYNYRYNDEPDAPVAARDVIQDTLGDVVTNYARLCYYWQNSGSLVRSEFYEATREMVVYLQYIDRLLSEEDAKEPVEEIDPFARFRNPEVIEGQLYGSGDDGKPLVRRRLDGTSIVE